MLHRICFAAILLLSVASFADEPSMKALIIEGQNNHGVWPKTSQMMKRYLEETKLFTVDIVRTAPEGTDPNFHPDFSQYQVVVSNYNGASWPEETQKAFVDYVAGGGGFVVVHAANNSFGDWKEYNDMIGLGGWGGRNETTGPYVYLDEKGQLIRNSDPGPGGSHGAQHEFLVVTRDDTHPITRGMPASWMHAQDELYDRLRGPGERMNVLATAYADPAQGGTGRHEPMMMVVEYGKGRVFHTPMGHGDYSQECVGFIIALQRGAEWAATGEVTQELPKDFPTAEKVSQRKFEE
jgi:type 1 glutamine amidotransferase